MKKAQGFTLLETMMAMAISVTLLVIIERIFLTQQKNLQYQFASAVIYNKFYFVKEILTKAVHDAGFMGCRNLTESFSSQHPNLITPQNLIEIQTPTNLLITRTYKPIDQIKNDNKQYLISDCAHAELIQTNQPLKYSYQINAQFFVYQQNNFYLKRNSLYLQDQTKKSDEVIGGVDAIEIFLDKKLLTIFMILNNEKNINIRSQVLHINDNEYQFSDGRLHQLFKLVIFLREKND